jgi:hypothetical protein
MLDLHCPESGSLCGCSGIFLVCSIQVLPLERLASRLGLKWPGHCEHKIPTLHDVTHGQAAHAVGEVNFDLTRPN